MDPDETPIASCPANGVDAFAFPFFVKRGDGLEPDQLLLEIHLYHLSEEDRASMGELVEVGCVEDLAALGYPRDDRGVYLVGEEP